MVVISSSKRAAVAPRTSTSTCATSSPAFHQSCGVPGGTSTASPGPAVRSSPSTRRPTVPASTSKRSAQLGVHVLAGHGAAGLHVQIDDHVLGIAAVLAADPHDRPLAGDRVGQHLA